MKGLIRLIVAAGTLIVMFGNTACGQILRCDKLQQVIKAVAADSTLNALKGQAWDDKGDDYKALVVIWDKEDDDHFGDILADHARHRFYYRATFLSAANGKKEFAEIAETMKACLGNAWTLKLVTQGYDGATYNFKNEDNNVVIYLFNDSGAITVSCAAANKK